jgi:glycopeptide antibiotics resistance protein
LKYTVPRGAGRTSWLLAWLYLIVLWLTWTPTGEGGPELLSWWRLSDWPLTLGNVLLFAPIGLVWAAARASTQVGEVRRGRLVAETAAVIALLSLVVELGQLSIPGRSTSLQDLAMNTAGGAAAAWLASHLVRAGVDTRVVTAAVAAAVFAGVLIFLSATGFATSRMLRLEEWDAEYPVRGGAEVGGERLYDGTVDEARICAGAPDREFCVEPGADSVGRRRVARRATGHQRARLSAVVTSHAPQAERARIVTFSRDGGYRNATLAQDGRSLVLRIRTPFTGVNGTLIEVVLPEAVREDRPTRVEAFFESGRITLTADDGTSTVGGDVKWGFFTGWWISSPAVTKRRFLKAGGFMFAAVISAAAFSLPVGYVTARQRWAPGWLRLVAAALVPPSSLFSLSAVFQIPVHMEDLALSVGFGLLGALVAAVSARPASAPTKAVIGR